LFLPTKFAAFGHGPGRARIFDLAVFGVIHSLPKAAMGVLFVNLGATGFVPSAHHVHHGFFAAHELANNGVDQTLIHKGLQPWRCFHVGRFSGAPPTNPHASWFCCFRTPRRYRRARTSQRLNPALQSVSRTCLCFLKMALMVMAEGPDPQAR